MFGCADGGLLFVMLRIVVWVFIVVGYCLYGFGFVLVNSIGLDAMWLLVFVDVAGVLDLWLVWVSGLVWVPCL